MRKFAIPALAAIAIFNLASCQEGENVPGATVAGAAVGGVLGGTLFHGSGQWAGIIGGAVLGGIVGDQIGQAMDRRDRLNMQNAIVVTPVGQQASWTNTKTQTTYVVRPIRNYHHGNLYCREFQTRIYVAGRWQQGYGRACRQPDGTWKIVS